MSRPRGSSNKPKTPKEVQASDAERLEYLAALLLEIVEEDLRESEVAACSQA